VLKFSGKYGPVIGTYDFVDDKFYINKIGFDFVF
jgi:hypothetical protein